MFSWIRRWPRQALLFFMIALALLPWSGWKMLALFFADPRPEVDWIARANELIGGPPSADDAWPIYRDIIVNDFGISVGGGGATPDQTAVRLVMNSELLHGDWNETDRSASLATLHSLRHILDKLDAAATRSQFRKHYVHKGDSLTGELDPSVRRPFYDYLLPELQSLKWLGRLNAAAMRDAAHQSDWNDVVTRVRCGVRLGGGLMKQVSLIEKIVGLSILAITQTELTHLTQELDIPAEVCASLIQQLEDGVETLDWAKAHLIDEVVLSFDDLIQWTYALEPPNEGTMLLGGFLAWPDEGPFTLQQRLLNLLGPLAPSKDDASKELDVVRATLEEIMARPLPDTGPSDSFLQWLRRQLPIAAQTTPNLPATFRQFDYMRSHIAGARLALLLEIHHERTGHWPDALTEAVPELDARDPVSGEFFDYELLIDDEHGRHFELRVPWATHENLIVVNPPRPPLTATLLGTDTSE